MKDGDKVASDPHEQVVSGGAGEWIVLPLWPNAYIAGDRRTLECTSTQFLPLPYDLMGNTMVDTL